MVIDYQIKKIYNLSFAYLKGIKVLPILVKWQIRKQKACGWKSLI